MIAIREFESTGIIPVKQQIRKGKTIMWISDKDMEKIVKMYVFDEIQVSGLFISESVSDISGLKLYTAADIYCDCYVEEFYSKNLAIRWLTGDYESLEELLEADNRYYDKLEVNCQL